MIDDVREVMPHCVIKDVRERWPNPPNVSYQGTGGPSSEYEELYVFCFLLICERLAKRDMGHILLPNNRIGSRET